MRRGWQGRISGGITACLLVAVLGLAAGSVSAGEKWGPFRGRFVDVETGQGIAGGVVLAVWDRAYPTLAGTATEFHDAREVVSTADGHFEMPRLDPPFFRLNVRAPRFTIFAPGYAAIRWVVTPEDGDPLVDLTVIEMRPVKTREERLRNYRSIFISFEIPEEKYRLLKDALIRERRNLGLD